MLPMMTNNYRNAMNWMPGFVNEFFNDVLPATREMHAAAPALNVIENKTEYKLELAVPGTTKEDYSIQLTESGNLMVKLEKKQTVEGNAPKAEEQNSGNRYLRREFSYQKFLQTFTLPEDVECSKISANVADGVLSITLPKKEHAIPTCRQIEIA